MNIEPMSVEQIKEMVELYDLYDLFETCHPLIIVSGKRGDYARLILAWAHERARGNRLDHKLLGLDEDSSRQWPATKCLWTESDWLNEVLDEIGWPKEQL